MSKQEIDEVEQKDTSQADSRIEKISTQAICCDGFISKDCAWKIILIPRKGEEGSSIEKNK